MELSKNIKEMCRNLLEVYEMAYKEIKPTVDYIIKNKIKDISFIESVLDTLLSIETDKGCNLFIKLCDYLATIDKEIAIEYLSFYEEIHGKEDTKIKKKTMSFINS